MERSTGFFAATTVVATVVAIYLWQELRAERARSLESGAPAYLAAGQSDTLISPPTSVAQPRRAAEVAQQPVDLNSATPPSAGEGAEVSRMCESLKSRIRQSFGQAVYQSWLADLQLAPVEQEQVQQLHARQAGLVTGLPECGDEKPINGLEFAAAMRELLGPVRYEQYRDRQAASTTEANMVTLRTQVANLGSPLTDEQAAKLGEVINAENRRSRQEAALRPPSQDPRDLLEAAEEELELTRQRFDRILASARQLLNADQFRQLETNMQRQLAQTRSALDQRRQRIDTGAALAEGL